MALEVNIQITELISFTCSNSPNVTMEGVDLQLDPPIIRGMSATDGID